MSGHLIFKKKKKTKPPREGNSWLGMKNLGLIMQASNTKSVFVFNTSVSSKKKCRESSSHKIPHLLYNISAGIGWLTIKIIKKFSKLFSFKHVKKL